MTVQLPRDFAISNLIKIQITDFVKGLLWRLFAMHQVEMPIDGIAVVQIFVAKKIKLVETNFVSQANDLLRLVRKPLTKQRQKRPHTRRREEEPALPAAGRANRAFRKIK